jgi:prepilin-type N-terminal cleavage/methylation domain-containing protein
MRLLHRRRSGGGASRTDGRRAPRDARRGGFTLIELLVSVAIVGILAGLALPNLRTMIYRARATSMAGDMDVVRVATLSYNADNHSWPPETAEGEVPSELVPYLPENFSFDGDGYTLDFENWSLPGGLPGDPSTTTLIGVSVTTDDPALGNALIELLGSSIVFSVDNTHTIVIDRS